MYPSVSVAVPPAGTVTVVGFVPSLLVLPPGTVVSSITIVALPSGTSVLYVPFSSVTSVSILPVASVTSTVTPSIPGSPASCVPFPFVSS